MANAPGKGLLKVVGILFIIFGAIAAVVSLLGLLGGGVLASISAEAGSVVIVAAVIGLIGAALEIVVGILGVKNCDKPEKATMLMVFAIILIVIQAVGLILGGDLVMTIIGLVLPILFLIGAIKNKKAAA